MMRGIKICLLGRKMCPGKEVLQTRYEPSCFLILFVQFYLYAKESEMSKQFVRVFLTSFLALLLAVGGINLVSAAKPTPTPPPGPTPTPTPMQIYGAWHCGNH